MLKKYPLSSAVIGIFYSHSKKEQFLLNLIYGAGKVIAAIYSKNRSNHSKNRSVINYLDILVKR
ncbi:MAG: hypothetical protein ABIA37_03710 [Candidatus Woesearchaeota archaeon]